MVKIFQRLIYCEFSNFNDGFNGDFPALTEHLHLKSAKVALLTRDTVISASRSEIEARGAEYIFSRPYFLPREMKIPPPG